MPGLLSYLKTFPLEALVWVAGLAGLSLYYPSGQHISLCPLYHLGFDFCPGCGLGRAISYFFHGEIFKSLETHPLGIFAVIVLSLRIIKLCKLYLQLNGKNY